MLSNATVRTWFVFALPFATTYVPADDLDEARRTLAANAYPGAPVASWPHVDVVRASRDELVERLRSEAAALRS